MQTRAFLCSCNGTVAVDPDRIGSALASSGLGSVRVERADELCRRECSRAIAALGGTDDLVIGCTQEAPLFTEIAQAKRAIAPIRFVNLREQGGWGAEGAQATPKLAALVAAAAAEAAPAVAAVPYRSNGRLLVAGPAADALRWARRLAPQLSVSVLVTQADGTPLPATREFPLFSGELTGLTGWLGEFEARWRQRNPIDLEACVRCGACVEACPTGAIGADLQVDLARCDGHRACVKACGSIGAIDFARAEAERVERFDLVLDLNAEPAFTQHQPPQGYFHPGPDEDARTDAAIRLAGLVGEFEKPKFFRYDPKICAHQRNGIEGCRACIDVCSTRAISAAGEQVKVEPHLCMGCGACATVCPSGAMSFQYPSPAVIGKRVRDALSAYHAAGGRDAVVLFHDVEHGKPLIESIGRGAHRPGAGAARRAPAVRGLPARVIPFEVHHPASVGLDLMLSAIAFGASQVAVLFTGDEAPQYRSAWDDQAGVAQSLLEAMGYGAGHFPAVEAIDAAGLESATHALRAARTVATGARFALSDEKRRSIEFAIDHLVAEARGAGRSIPGWSPLPPAAPFGTLRVSPEACTLCLACVGSCPEKALLDNAETPQLRFIERNCVQCGLCVATCPEKAISMEPRWRFDEAARTPQVLNETQPFGCISCGKPFGTRRMVETMVARLSAHPLFGGQGARRLQMCGDCRVIDMATDKGEASIFDATPGR